MKESLKIKSKKGFTIMELMVSVTLIALMATVTLPVFVFALKANSQNKIRSTANSLATSIIETVNGTPYDDIGNINGSPEGIFDENTNVTIDGIQYNIETLITWEERGKNPEAFKNIKVTVRAVGTFTGTEGIVAEMFTSVLGDAKNQVERLGSIKAMVKKANNDSNLNSSIAIYAEGPLEDMIEFSTYIRYYDQEAIFEHLPIGTYNVYATIPSGYCTPLGETNESDSSVTIKKQVSVDSGSVQDVYFYIDIPDNLVKNTFVLVNPYGGHGSGYYPEIESGSLTMYWDINGNKKKIISDIEITSFREYLDSPFIISNLWPLGTYQMEIKDIISNHGTFNNVIVDDLEYDGENFAGWMDYDYNMEQVSGYIPITQW